jgi:hypothetical protein
VSEYKTVVILITLIVSFITTREVKFNLVVIHNRATKPTRSFKMKTAKWQLIAAILVLPILGACSATMGHVSDTMSDEEYLGSSKDVKDAYTVTVAEEAISLQPKKNAEYAAGRPVHYKDPETGLFRTIQWDKMLGIIYIYPGKMTGMMTMNTHGVVMAKATSLGAIDYVPDGRGGVRPVIFLGNVASEEGAGRMLTRGAFQVLAASANGAIAAKIYGDNDCGNNCGNITVQNGSSSQSASESAASGSANLGLNTCPSGNCAVIPTE